MRPVVGLAILAVVAATSSCAAKTALDVTPFEDDVSSRGGGEYCFFEKLKTTICDDVTESGEWEAFCYSGYSSCSLDSFPSNRDEGGCMISVMYREMHWVECCPGGVDSEGNCTPCCGGKECGDDGCGGTCGTCEAPDTCEEGKCINDCECEQGQKECDEDNLKHCNDGCHWESKACSEICEAAGYGESLGCVEGATEELTTCDCMKDGTEGTGDPCMTDDVCESGDCAGEFGAAWCTKPCLTYEDCLGNYELGTNVNGTSNTCVATVDATYLCFPRCKGNPDCSVYPDTVCILVLTSLGLQEKVCSK